MQEPFLDSMLTQHAMPKELKYLPLVLSGMRPDYRHEDRCGVWALPSLVAMRYGLTVDGYHDERYVTEAATKAALNYLYALYQKYNDKPSRRMEIVFAKVRIFMDNFINAFFFLRKFGVRSRFFRRNDEIIVKHFGKVRAELCFYAFRNAGIMARAFKFPQNLRLYGPVVHRDVAA